MSSIIADAPAPTSGSLERDARLVTADKPGVASSEIALGVIIGRTSESFDFFVYGIASVLVFPTLVFPFVDRVTGTLYSFAIFALAFVARPVGFLLFSVIDGRHGRGVKLTIALFLLGGSTAAIAFLPSYGQIGIAAAFILAACRIGQGVALGGAWDGLASLLATNAPPERRGWYASLGQLGAPFGFMVASSLFAFFLTFLTTDDFLSFGWRYPFFVAFTINVVALFARLRIVATREYAELFKSSELQPVPVAEVVRERGRNILVGAFVPLASYALFHLVTIFPISWIVNFTDRSASEFLMVQFAGATIAAGGVLTSGLAADQIGRRTLLAVSAGLIGLFSLLSIGAPLLFGDSAAGQTIFIIVGFGLLGLSFGQVAGAVSSTLGQRYRYTGAALTSDLAWMLGAGFAPLVALLLSSRLGLWSVGLYLLSGALCTLGALAWNRQLAHNES